MDRVPMRGQLRRYLFLNLLHRGVRVAGVEVRERCFRAIEQTSRLLERDNGVVEGWLFRAVRDRLDLLELFGHAGLDCRGETFVFDLVERRIMKRQLALSHERVVAGIG